MESTPLSPLPHTRLYEALAERVRAEYVDPARPGDRLPTEAQLSKQYRVSIPTVREALRSLVQSGCIERRQGAGSFKREAGVPSVVDTSNSKTAHVAIVTPMDMAAGGVSCHYNQLVFHTYRLLQEQDIPVALYLGETSPGSTRRFNSTRILDRIRRGEVSALLPLGETLENRIDYVEEAKSRGVPCISTADARSSEGRVQIEDFVKKSLDVLISHSRRKFACIGFGARDVFENARSFHDLVAERGGVTDEAWVVWDLHPLNVGSGYSLMREIWTTCRVKPDALLLCDDVFLGDVALAMKEFGIKCPEQLMVSVLRNEGERMVSPFPSIDVRYNARVLAEQIVQNVLRLIKGQPESPMIFDSQLKDPFVDEGAIAEPNI